MESVVAIPSDPKGVESSSIDQIDEDEDDFLLSTTNRVILDANQMLLDLKREIDNKNLLINNNSLRLEELKQEVTRKSQDLEELKKGHKEALFEKDKLVMNIIE